MSDLSSNLRSGYKHPHILDEPEFHLGLIRITAKAWLFLACLPGQLHRRLQQLTGVSVSILKTINYKDGAVKFLVQNAILTQTLPSLMGLDL